MLGFKNFIMPWSLRECNTIIINRNIKLSDYVTHLEKCKNMFLCRLHQSQWSFQWSCLRPQVSGVTSSTLKKQIRMVYYLTVLLTLPKLLIRITEDHHSPELNGQFPVLILLNLSAASVQLDLCVHSWSHHQESDMAEHTHAWSHHHIKIMNVFLIPRSSSASL